jgi:hypothetical protein
MVSGVTNGVTSASTRRPKTLAEHGETTPFIVTQLQPSTVQVSLKNPVLLP